MGAHSSYKRVGQTIAIRISFNRGCCETIVRWLANAICIDMDTRHSWTWNKDMNA